VSDNHVLHKTAHFQSDVETWLPTSEYKQPYIKKIKSSKNYNKKTQHYKNKAHNQFIKNKYLNQLINSFCCKNTTFDLINDN